MVKLKFLLILIACMILSACGSIVGDSDNNGHPTLDASATVPDIILERDSKNQLIINWTEQTNALNYTLLLSRSATFDSSLTESVIVDAPPFLVSANNSKTEYFVKIRANYNGRQSDFSNQTTYTVPPTAPVLLSITPTENDTIKLEWEENEAVDTYVIYRSESDILDIGSAFKIENVNSPHEDDTVQANKNYHYWLVSISANQSSAFSEKGDAEVIIDELESILPIAIAGLSQTAEVNSQVTLDGTASRANIDNKELSYLWTAPQGINLSAIGVAQPTFVVPTGQKAGSNLEFTLVVSDANGNESLSSQVEVTITNSDPEANAGNDLQVNVNDIVDLDGTASRDLNNDELLFQWIVPVSLNMSDANSATPKITIPQNLQSGHVINVKLVVKDNHGGSSEDSISLTLKNTPPTANPGNDLEARVGDSISLDGGLSSDVNDDALKYFWTVPSELSLSDPNAKLTSLSILSGANVGKKVVTLTVTDEFGDSSEAALGVTVLNTPPIAHAGNDVSASVGDSKKLDGTKSSDANNDKLAFTWSTPEGIQLSDLNFSNPTISILPGTKAGNKTIQLTVTDIHGGTSTDEVVITILNTPPVSVAGNDQSVQVGDVVSLDAGQSHDANQDDLTYSWVIDNAIQLTSLDARQTSFVVPPGKKDGDSFLLSLQVSDGQVLSAIDELEIFVANSPPIADAGIDQSVGLGVVTSLNAENSQDDNQDDLDYFWEIIDAPAASIANIENANAKITLFKPDVIGDFTLRVTVSDPIASASDDIKIASIILAPEVIAITGGTFQMGDETSVDGVTPVLGSEGEVPLREVSVAAFEMGKYEVTFAEFDQYLMLREIDPVSDPSSITKGGLHPYDGGFGRRNRPVINVTFTDVKDYLNWLNTKLDIHPDDPTRYRLPTEAEWEYAARAGTVSAFNTGNCLLADQANFNGNFELNYTAINGDVIHCPTTNVYLDQTVEVGSYVSNNFGLYDMHGNAFEWVEDCYHSNYENAPLTAKAWLEENDGVCTTRMLRSGSWWTNSSYARSSKRIAHGIGFKGDDRDGFRIARSLTINESLRPNMVTILGGTFDMGDETSLGEQLPDAGSSDELPVHSVNVPDFEIGKYEVTFAEYDYYLQMRSANPVTSPSKITSGQEAYDHNFGRGLRPVIHVSWEDTQEYINWLNRQLGISLDDPKRYRLPTEAEWEYASRGSNIAAYNTGDCVNTDQANYKDLSESDVYSYINVDDQTIDCPISHSFVGRTASVGTYPANSNGLHDMAGNVWEWVQDCDHGDYTNAPIDGSAWLEEGSGDCSKRIARGGSWLNGVSFLRSSERVRNFTNIRDYSAGFRLVRSL